MNESDSDVELHEFLLDADNELHDAMRKLPRIRDYIESLPDTASTFKLSQIDDLYQPNFEDVHLEFCKSWRLDEYYSPKSSRVYLNPSHIHAHKYSDLVVQCECGAEFTRNYEDGGGSLRDEHNHRDDCLPHWRLRARARMSEAREMLLKRLGKLGWKGSDIAPRFGTKPSSMGGFAKRYNTTLRDVFNEYRRIAGNTYVHLIRCGESATDVAEVYGHAQSTMTRWAKKYSDVTYDTDVGRNQFSEGLK